MVTVLAKLVVTASLCGCCFTLTVPLQQVAAPERISTVAASESISTECKGDGQLAPEKILSTGNYTMVHNGILRIEPDSQANSSWELSCVNERSHPTYQNMIEFTGKTRHNTYFQTEFQKRPPCALQRCFRAVFDDVIPSEFLDDPRSHELELQFAIKKVLRERLHVSGLQKYLSLFRDEDSPDQDPGTWGGLHADVQEVSQYMFTAILYLEGGPHYRPTGIADMLQKPAKNATAKASELVSGLIVMPRRGRLLLFSGGAENWHSVLPLGRTRRHTFHVWFECTG
eukprot:gnl/TRDRNA2_/TRDRNA2_188055_c0_seq1.p1 gnl/TRDRNA2_/TRDRNA2_188055_c0~~gnl/TRDRNA2_/TRDRNA2_188055_c0_seq1.p1  ORF type:complete len:285 (+),score=25.68 gnl/TRDRNA2_/TRDRNA2_188055_c0_seq1:67-921(+)